MYTDLGTPGGYAHILNGTILFTVVLFVIFNVSNIQNIDIYKKITLLLLISISIGIHGISHLWLDSTYNLNDGSRCNRCNRCPKRVRFSI